MNQERQAIELLRLLGDEAADAVLAHMAPAQAESLRSALQKPAPGASKSHDKIAVLDSFQRYFQFARKSHPGGIALHVHEDEPAESEQPEFEGADDADARPLKLTGDALTDLGLLSNHQVAGALEAEQPRTAAILLNKLPPELAAELLSLLPSDHRNGIVKELGREQEAPQVLLERIARATLQRGLTLPPNPPDRRDRVDRLGDMLRAVPKKLRRDMMHAIEEDNEELGKALLKKLYRFEDIEDLDGRMIQQVLGEVDSSALTRALFGADEELVDAILSNLSKRARQTIEEELQFQTSVPESQVTAAREIVAEVIAKIDQEGE